MAADLLLQLVEGRLGRLVRRFQFLQRAFLAGNLLAGLHVFLAQQGPRIQVELELFLHLAQGIVVALLLPFDLFQFQVQFLHAVPQAVQLLVLFGQGIFPDFLVFLYGKKFLVEGLQLFFLFRDVAFTGQVACLVMAAAAAGQGTAGIDDVPVQRDRAEAEMPFAGRVEGGVEVFRHQHPSQQEPESRFRFGIAADQIGREAADARQLGQGLFVRPELRAADRIERQERRPACLLPFQEGDGLFGGVRRADDDILGTGAEGRFHGRHVFRIHLD